MESCGTTPGLGWGTEAENWEGGGEKKDRGWGQVQTARGQGRLGGKPAPAGGGGLPGGDMGSREAVKVLLED